MKDILDALDHLEDIMNKGFDSVNGRLDEIERIQNRIKQKSLGLKRGELINSNGK